MSFMWNIGFIIIALVIVRISQRLFKWWSQTSNRNGKLPPGSMGFPIIGETIEFLKPCGLLEIPPFFQKRMLRYGSLFRTNILGSNTVISTDAEVIFEIFRQENRSFVLTYPDAFVKLFGKENLFLKGKDIHKHIKQITLNFIGSEGLKRKMIESINQATREHLKMKAREGTFDLKDAVSRLIISYLTPKLISNLKPETQAKLMDHLNEFNFDWFKSPFSPWTWKIIYKVNKARKEAAKMIKEAFERRKESREKHGDFLDALLEDMEKEGNNYDQKFVINVLIVVLLTSKDTSSMTTALIVNFIAKHPKVLAELKRENEAILQQRDSKEAGVSWEEYKHNMTFTNMVVMESLRLSNLGTILFRKVVEDVEIKGYTIPAGWKVAVATSVVHYNPAIYENPMEFNPWRWQGKDFRTGSKTLMVFGGGTRQCVGADFAKLHLSIFLHHLVTTYDFSVVQECEVERVPLPYFTKTLLINMSPRLPAGSKSG